MTQDHGNMYSWHDNEGLLITTKVGVKDGIETRGMKRGIPTKSQEFEYYARSFSNACLRARPSQLS